MPERETTQWGRARPALHRHQKQATRSFPGGKRDYAKILIHMIYVPWVADTMQNILLKINYSLFNSLFPCLRLMKITVFLALIFECQRRIKQISRRIRPVSGEVLISYQSRSIFVFTPHSLITVSDEFSGIRSKLCLVLINFTQCSHNYYIRMLYQTVLNA